MDNRFKHGVIIAAVTLAPLGLSGCATGANNASLPPAPLMDSLSDAPIVTNAPTLPRTDPVGAIKTMTKGDAIEVKAPVPVLSATMPVEGPAEGSVEGPDEEP
ncbi:hypothetical protein [Fretibacter rubidus]|uniref:hypothetical protein n=1 Tax=Fretibacter rubidus TaxID=570162 RepID=UPI00352ADD7E